MGQQGGIGGMLLPLVMFVAIFYFMIVRPQKKKQKAHDDMIASISRGDQVITAGGFFGTVRDTLDDSYIIDFGDGVKARILKSSISMKKSDSDTVNYQPKKKKKKSDTQAEQQKSEELPAAIDDAQPVEVPAAENQAVETETQKAE